MQNFLFICLLVCIRRTSRANCSENVRVSMAEQQLTPSQQVTGSIPGNDMLFFCLGTGVSRHSAEGTDGSGRAARATKIDWVKG